MVVLSTYFNPMGNQIIVIPKKLVVKEDMFLRANTRCKFDTMTFDMFVDYVKTMEDIGRKVVTERIEGTPFVMKYCKSDARERDGVRYLEGTAILMKADTSDPFLTEREMEEARIVFLEGLEVSELYPGAQMLNVEYRLNKEETIDE